MPKIIYFIIGLMLSSWLYAAESMPKAKIMAVNFELRDVSPIPNTKQEIERTEQLDTVIRNTLKDAGYTLMPPCEALVKASQQGLGYLYDRPEVAGKIGRECGADYVLMGQTWKPSFLFVFPQVQVVDTRQGLTREQLVPVSRSIQLEASTMDRNVTDAAGKKLGKQIVEKLSN